MKNTISNHYKRGLTQQYRNSTHVEYPQIGFKCVKKGKCEECGKPRQLTTTFYQTQSPWNKKTESEICEEEKVKVVKWAEKEFKCKCGGIVK